MSTSNSTILIKPDYFLRNLGIYILTGISLFGFIGNILNIIVFTNLRLFRGVQSIFYLTIESIANIGQNLGVLIGFLLLLIYDVNPEDNFLIWCKLKNLIVQCLGLISILIMCFAACDQYFSTNLRYYFRQKSTLKLAYYLTFISICCSILFGILIIMYFNINLFNKCSIKNSIFLFYYSYIHFPILFGLIPICISSILSYLSYRNVRHIICRRISIVRRQLDQQLTAMILLRITFFVTLTLPYIIYYLYTLHITNPTNRLLQIIGTVCRSLGVLNTAISFYILWIFSGKYRHQVKLVLTKKLWRKLRKSLCGQQHQPRSLTMKRTRVFSVESESAS